jgi:SAM-dependent methyltransferase
MNDQDIKKIVKEKYTQIVNQSVGQAKPSCGCGCGCGSEKDGLADLQPAYDKLQGYVPDADLGLGCGLPTEYAGIKKGDSVLDLGSGAGNDAFITAKLVGLKGTVIGVDMTPDMIRRANQNKQKYAFSNVEFRLGDIENLPLESEQIDVVISNCVINLARNKRRVYSEIFRVLKPGAHFCISDIVTKGNLPEGLKRSAELYTGCLAGALELEELKDIITEVGFRSLKINKEKQIFLENTLVEKYLAGAELAEFEKSRIGIFSITISAYK